MNFSLMDSASVIVFRKATLEPLPSELWYWTIASRTTRLKISTESAIAWTGSISLTDWRMVLRISLASLMVVFLCTPKVLAMALRDTPRIIISLTRARR